jgi:hypothetical protein
MVAGAAKAARMAHSFIRMSEGGSSLGSKSRDIQAVFKMRHGVRRRVSELCRWVPLMGSADTQTDGPMRAAMVRDNPQIDKQVAAMRAPGSFGLPDDIGPIIAALLSDDNRLDKRAAYRGLRQMSP